MGLGSRLGRHRHAAVDPKASEFYAIASKLREQHTDPSNPAGWTFTHIPTSVAPTELLAWVRDSALAPLAVSETTVLAYPGEPYYVPLQPVTAADGNAIGVRLTASTWERGRSEPTVAIRYQQNGECAQQVWNVNGYADGRLSLTRSFYAEQRGETGYEGGNKESFEATGERLTAFAAIIARLAA